MYKSLASSRQKSLQALDYLNVFLADVRDGVGPYLAIYLMATHHWGPASIGVAMSASGIAGVIAQSPVGLLIDVVRQKRLLIAIAGLLVATGCLAIVLVPQFPVVITAQALIGIAGTIFPPAVAAITLGIVGHSKLDRRLGRNEAFNHAGNVVAAVLAGLLGHFLGREWIFYLVVAMSLISTIAVMRIRERDIDHKLARGAVAGISREEEIRQSPHISGFKTLLQNRLLITFAISVVLFHFANAAMLPLVGQKLSAGKASGASLYMSACIIVAQLVMIPVSGLAGQFAGRWGRKAIFLIAFTVLPIRGVLYTLSDNPYFLVSVQVLDGIAAGIFGVLWVLIVADLTKGTGRFNLVQGAIATATGLGASLSNLIAGFIVKAAGYNAAFLTLAAIAGVALLVFGLLMPETKVKFSLQEVRF